MLRIFFVEIFGVTKKFVVHLQQLKFLSILSERLTALKS